VEEEKKTQGFGRSGKGKKRKGVSDFEEWERGAVMQIREKRKDERSENWEETWIAAPRMFETEVTD